MISTKKIRIAILGASGIGRVHARIFHKAGVDVCAVLGSSKESAKNASNALKDSYGINSQSYHCLDRMLEEARPNAVSICTPPQFHFEEIIAAFEKQIGVFCEKPLFWYSGISNLELEDKLAQIATHPHRKLWVNTSNAFFVEQIKKLVSPIPKKDGLTFCFQTQGLNQGREIGVDLLPHGLSILLELFGNNLISNLSEKYSANGYNCGFNYGEHKVVFNFHENKNMVKKMIIELDGRQFTRCQEGNGANYKVLFHDSYTLKKFEVEDPFKVYINKFLNSLRIDLSGNDEFEVAAKNLRLMGKILLEST
jgi:hypothetical protein